MKNGKSKLVVLGSALLLPLAIACLFLPSGVWASGTTFLIMQCLTIAVLFSLRFSPKPAMVLSLFPWVFYTAALTLLSKQPSINSLIQTLIFLIIWISGVLAVFSFKKQMDLKGSALKNLDKLLTELKTRKKETENELTRMNKSLVLEIRAHTEAETRLRESEEKYRNLVNSLPEGILIVQESKIVFFNPGFENLTSVDPKDLYTLDPKELFHGFSLNGPDNNLDTPVFLNGPDQSRVYVETQWVEIQFNGQPARLYTIRDITERVLAGMEKERLESELEKAKKMEAIGLMAAGVAHDLNNVLSGIVSTPEVLLMELPKESELKEMVMTIKDSGRRASVIVDQLLTLGRGGDRVNEPVALNEIIEDYLGSPEFLKKCEDHPHINLETSLDEHLPWITGSGMQMRKMVMNLVINAMEAIEDRGQVTLTTGQTRFKEASIKGYKNKLVGDYIRLSVEDTGPGIAPDDLDRIFEPFYTKKILGRSGTGLGLSIVWNIIHDHKGYLQVNSSPKGTCFDIYLPVSSALQDEEKPDKIYTLSDYTGNNEIILVVDDERNQLTITSNMLRRMGYRVATAASGEAALEYLNSHRVDLIVLDMIMTPGIDGLSTFRQLKRIDPKIRAVLASGYSKTKEVDMAQTEGAGEFIKKPFSLQTLGLAVKKELERDKNDPPLFQKPE